MSSGSSLPLGLEAREPHSGVGFTQVLRGHRDDGQPGAPRDLSPVLRGAFGVVIALSGYALIAPLVQQLVLAVAWVLRGRPTSFSQFYADAVAYRFVDGMIASHLALASLIGLTMLIVRWWHLRSPRWLISVQPGMRWRYLVGCLVISAVGLNVVMWLSRIGTPTVISADSHWWVWLLVIVVFSPLQAAGEEFFFRGYLMQALGAMFRNKWVGVVLSATMFAFFHGVQNLWLFADRFAFGLLAGSLVLLTGGLEAAIAAHVANNLFAFGYGVFFGGVAATKAVTHIGPVEAAWDIAGFALVAAAAWWFGRRMNVATATP